MKVFKPSWDVCRLGIIFSQNLNKSCQVCKVNNGVYTQFFVNKLVCLECYDAIVWLPKPHNITLNNGQTLDIQAVTHYELPASNLIKKFKIDCDMSVLPMLIYMIEQLILPKGCKGNTIIIPMPTTTLRLVDRGFDPVLIMAKYLSKQWNIPLWQKVLMKQKDQEQKALTRIERTANMKNIFTLETEILADTVILFDDISTTGASFKSLAETIINESKHPLNIYAFCIAH